MNHIAIPNIKPHQTLTKLINKPNPGPPIRITGTETPLIFKASEPRGPPAHSPPEQ